MDVIHFLVDLTEISIAPDNHGYTLIHEAATNGHLGIVKFLVDFTNTPNTPEEFWTDSN